jgi:hypothetical protein
MKLSEPMDDCRMMLATSAIAHKFFTVIKDVEKSKS